MAPSLEIRVLGELEVLRDGKAVALPASKKTRALLGYLVLAGSRPQPRQRLCDLLWDGPSDPRAALRWSLTKLRPLVDEVGTTRLSADREHVAFVPGGARVDRTAVGDDLGAEASPSVDPSVRGPVDRGEVSVEVSVEVLRRAAAVFRGELLEGLDLPECYRFHEWCVAEREAARGVRASILATLVQRLAAVPEDALGYARARVAVDPLSEAGHIAVIELLVRLGRSREALKQYESCRRILEVQVGRGPSRALEVARFAIGKAPADAPSEPLASRAVVVPSVARAALVGRRAESAIIAEALRAATAREPRRVLLLSGEPGIGKTRLLAEVAEQAVARGGTAIVGRAFEAEMVRPYGAWIAALRSLPQGAIDGSLHAELAPLLPELGAARDETDRNRLFDAVSRLLQQRAASGPVVVALDDLQWFDEASVALLSSLSQSGAQSLAGSPVLFACAARSAEVDANPGVVALLRGLGRGGRLTRVELSPLDCEATAALVHSVDSHADASQIFADGGGNPLFSLELARAFGNRGELGDRGDADGGGAGHTLEGLIAERLARLDGRAAELLPWAAALGHAFSIDTLGALTSLAAPALLSAVEELERHGVLRATNAAEGCASYDFAHDLVRRTAYRALSEPRRRWVHLHVARTLHAANDDGGALAGDVAHHAALGGDSALAVSAYVAAGERGLRLFAYADANRLAGSGLPHADRLPAEARIRARLALMSVQVRSNQWLRRAHELEAELSRVAVAAQQRGMHAEQARSLYLISVVHNERGDFARARARSLEAARAVRAGDVEGRAEQLANTGRCLAQIERDLANAEDLLHEVQALAPDATGRTRLDVAFGLGLLNAFRGLDDEAVRFLEEAAHRAELEPDHWARSQVLTRIARLELERGRPGEALARCQALEPLVAKLSEGSERPLVVALQALARLGVAGNDESGRLAVERSVDGLRALDSQAHVAYVLNALAGYYARAEHLEGALRAAGGALEAAEAVGQTNEIVVARARLALIALDAGKGGPALALLEAYGPALSTRLALSARARAAFTAVAQRLGGESDIKR